MELIKIEQLMDENDTKCGFVYRNAFDKYSFVCLHCGNVYALDHIVDHMKNHLLTNEDQPKINDAVSPQTVIKEDFQHIYTENCYAETIAFENISIKNEDDGEENCNIHKNESKLGCCRICKETFTSPFQKSYHLKMHKIKLVNGIYECPICGIEMKRILDLLKHGEHHENKRPSDCVFCARKFSVKAELKAHMMKMHQTEELFECDYCGMKYTQKYSLKTHMTKNHTSLDKNLNRKNFKCSLCPRTFYYERSLDEHLKLHDKIPNLNEKQATVNVNKFQICSVCSRSFRYEYQLQRHLNIHANLRKYKCELCHAGFNNLSSLSSHRKIHQSTPIKCDICGITCSLKANFKRHYAIHMRSGDTKDKPYECEICQKRYFQNNSLLVHRRTHTGERPYQCYLCGIQFINLSKYNYHLRRTHSKDRPFKCEHCTKSFHFNYQLTEHLKYHSDARMYECKTCGKTFKTTKILKQHSMLHNSVKKYKCHYCDMRFAQQAGRRGHERHRHLVT